MKVIKNGKKIETSYSEVCHDLDFNPDVHFVKITNHGTITFTAGKSEEIKSLRRACEVKGYKIAKSLLDRT